jgi:hypothetical protein
MKIVVASVMFVVSAPGLAASWDEAVHGDLSNDRWAPSAWLLEGETLGSNGKMGHNILSGRTGRAAPVGEVDRDYVTLRVPAGFVWTELRVGQQTQVGGTSGAFIGLAGGTSMSTPADAASAEGLLGWHHYALADRGTDILPRMAVPQAGSSGFVAPLPAGDYTLWIQELAPGSYAYRFNLVLSPVPEPGAVGLALAAGAALRRARRDTRRG